MFGLRGSPAAFRRTVPVTIGRGGFAPVVVLAGVFAAFGNRAGIPVGMAALLGGVGGTASLLVHEFGHVSAARRSAGIRSAAVSLIWLGAATRFEGTYANGRDQARVAIAGPEASFACALVLVAGCFLPLPLDLKKAALLLALFNVMIGLLNLVPASPLDGHKLVVGLLWCATGSERKARRMIRRVGLGWAAVELPSAALLILQRPHLGFAVVAVAASFMVQNRVARRTRLGSRS